MLASLLVLALPYGSALASPEGQLSDTAPAGNTGGALAVTSTGAAVTSIPIQVPPGVGGLVPSLSVNYNSSSGSGDVGVGFSLAATSAIKRCGHTLSEDFDVYPITYRDDATGDPIYAADWLCIDGMRLVGLENGLKIGRVYRLFQDDHRRVVAVTSPDGLPGFEVQLPDGSKQFYGTDDQSRVYKFEVDVAGGVVKRPYAWKLTRVEDAHGNVMTYHYTYQDNFNDALGTASRLEHRLAQIRYANDTRRVEFQYDRLARDEMMDGFFSSTRYRQPRRLTGILTFAPSAIAAEGERMVRQYKFQYTNLASTTKKFLLESVKECVYENDGEVCKPETSFTWQSGAINGEIALEDAQGDFAFDSNLFPVYGVPETDHAAVFQMTQLDGNHDGTTDLLVAPAGDGSNQPQTWSFWAVRPTPQESQIIDTNILVRTPRPIPQSPVEICDIDNQCRDYLLPGDAIGISNIDYNGDARTDVMGVEGYTSTHPMFRGFGDGLQILVQESTCDDTIHDNDTEIFAEVRETGLISPSPTKVPPVGNRILLAVPGDFNGDGLTDLMACIENENLDAYFGPEAYKPLPGVLEGSTLYRGFWHYFENETNGVSNRIYHDIDGVLENYPCSVLDKVHVMDFDGDGSDNLMYIYGYSNDTQVENDPDGQWPPVISGGHWLSPVELQDETYRAILYRKNPGNNGNNFHDVDTDLPFDFYQRLHAAEGANWACLQQYGALCRGNGLGADKVGDVNGDGLPDVVRFESNATLEENHFSPFVNQQDGEMLDDWGAQWEGRIEVWLNIGGHFVRSHDWDHTYGATSFHAQFLNAHLVDWDRDGRSELLMRNDAPQDLDARPLVFEYPLNASASLQWTETTLPALPWKLDERMLSLGDYNADGLLDVMARTTNPDGDNDPHNDPWLLDFHIRQGNVPDLLYRVANGHGAAWSVQYKPMTDVSVYRESECSWQWHSYTNDTDSRPFDARPLVSSLFSPLGIAPTVGSQRTNYFYEDAQRYRAGNQFLGFTRRMLSDAGATGPDAPAQDYASVRSELYRHYPEQPNNFASGSVIIPNAGKLTAAVTMIRNTDPDHPEGARAVLENYAYDTLLGGDFQGDPDWQGPLPETYYLQPVKMNSRVRTFDDVEAWWDCCSSQPWYTLTPEAVENMVGLGDMVPLTDQWQGIGSTTYDVDFPDSCMSTMDMWATGALDAQGFPTQSCSEDLISGARYETELEYEHRLTSWQLGLLRKREVTHKLVPADPQPKTRTVAMTYNTFGDTDLVTVEPDLPEHRSFTAYGYDSYGNVNSVHVWDAEGNDRTTVLAYGANGVFPITRTNALGHISSMTWEPGLGTRLSSTDPSGVKTIQNYDRFGRPTFAQVWAQNTPMSPGTTITYEPLAFLPPRMIVDTPGHGHSKTTFDELGRPAQTVSKGFKDEYEVFRYAQYDHRGRLMRTSVPVKTGQPVVWTRMYYDVQGRLIERIDPSGIDGLTSTRWIYDGLKTTQIDPDENQTWILTDTRGNLVRSADGHKAEDANVPGSYTEMCYAYGHFEGLNQVAPCQPTALRSPVLMGLDLYNQRLTLTDAQTGLQTFDFDPLGQMRRSLNAEGEELLYHYDALGRLDEILDSEGGTTLWSYDVTRPGALHESVSRDGNSRLYLYDAFGRLNTTEWTINGDSFTVEMDYDSFGRPLNVRYPDPFAGTSFAVQRTYDAYGHLLEVTGNEGTTFWEQLAADPFGGTHEERLGNGTLTTRQFDASTGRLETIRSVVEQQNTSVTVQDLEVQWTKGMDLHKRIDHVRAQSETFSYDPKHQLLGALAEKGADTRTESYSYDPFGNLQDRTGVGTYTYQNERLASAGDEEFWYNQNGAVIARSVNGVNTALTWDPFGRVKSIMSLPDYELELDYDADGNRVRRFDDQSQTETVLVGELYRRERKLNEPFAMAKHTYVVKVGGRTVAELTRLYGTNGNVTQADVHYVLADALGSTDLVMAANGNVVEERSYSPWGEARDPDDWTDATLFSTDSLVKPGFTGHEGRLDGGFTFMRGRMYAPSVGRFISPDPIVQAPFTLVSLNRYAYVWNNPLSATDPSGFKKCFVNVNCQFDDEHVDGVLPGPSGDTPSGGDSPSDPGNPANGGSGPGSGGGGGGGNPSNSPRNQFWGDGENWGSQSQADPTPVSSAEAAETARQQAREAERAALAEWQKAVDAGYAQEKEAWEARRREEQEARLRMPRPLPMQDTVSTISDTLTVTGLLPLLNKAAPFLNGPLSAIGGGATIAGGFVSFTAEVVNDNSSPGSKLGAGLSVLGGIGQAISWFTPASAVGKLSSAAGPYLGVAGAMVTFLVKMDQWEKEAEADLPARMAAKRAMRLQGEANRRNFTQTYPIVVTPPPVQYYELVPSMPQDQWQGMTPFESQFGP
ncbi:RHS repeat-associated core domain-containing protein [Polyangium fumosum]|nr:RHS repeat-associated core domain-containing protein [Polyangium fumosum]